jgi:hypothetical protein
VCPTMRPKPRRTEAAAAAGAASFLAFALNELVIGDMSDSPLVFEVELTVE